VVAGTAAPAGGTIGDCPSTAVEVGTAILWVGYRLYGTSEEHR
jgi:hypothetical protein